MAVKLAPKSQQPKGGFQHPKHLLGYDDKEHLAFNLAKGLYMTREVCVSPSSEIYDPKYLNGA